ncbi:hypothetical protein C5S42_12660 [Candidatus Methanomarinus sp.]|nr:hypothetical protein C5S42_12660 [ANME-2 cluster archaeon]
MPVLSIALMSLHKKMVTIQPYINVIVGINNPVLFNDSYLLNLDEINGNRISMKKYIVNEHK